MAQLIVRGLDEDLVQALKRRAAGHGRSAEAEHRAILRDAFPPKPPRRSLKDHLLAMPQGEDNEELFERLSRLRSRRRLVSFLLDTNVVSEFRKKNRDEHVVAWLASVDPGDLYLSVLVLGEARYGIELRRRRDPKHAAALERWYDKLVAEHAGRILDVDMRISDLWSHVRAPRPLPAIDSLLAATALAHDLTLVTRNVRQLEGTGVRTLNPFEPA